MTKKNMYKKSDRTFVNPYNFVSIDRKKIKQENIEETYKDKEELHTGYLDCVLVAKRLWRYQIYQRGKSLAEKVSMIFFQ